MNRFAAVFAALALSVAALLFAAAALQPAALAAPEAPAATHIIDDCSPANGEANFDAALAKAKDRDTILVRCNDSTRPAVITFTAEKAITKPVTINGTDLAGNKPNALSGGGAVRLFFVQSGAALTLTGIVLENGWAGGYGGCINASGPLVAWDTTFRHCSSGGYGGAISAGLGVTLANTTLYSDTADGCGGALYAANGSALLEGVRFTGNRADSGGGLCALATNALTLRHTEFSLNSVDEFGGGGMFSSSHFVVGTNLTFTQNTAPRQGGAWESVGDRVAITDVLVAGNSSTGEYATGGGLHFHGADSASLSNVTVLSNTASWCGGGLYATVTAITVSGSAILSNAAGGAGDPIGGGGGICVGHSESVLTLIDSRVTGNSVGADAFGGGIRVISGTAALDNVVLSGNRGGVGSLGGGLYLNDATATINGLTAEGNSGVDEGGGIFAEGSLLNITDAHIRGNAAQTAGAGLHAYHSTMNLLRVTVSGHRGGAASGGGLACDACLGTWQELTVSGNTAGGLGGGLVASDAGLIIRRSTFEGNSAPTGGGIYNSTSRLDLTNVTLSGNRASGDGGGLYNADGLGASSIITLTNATLKDNKAANGGNIYNGTPDTSIVLKNTVLADSAGGGNCKGKALTSSKYSLSTDGTCSLTGTGDLNNTPALLNPLAWVGGSTRVHLPKPDSPLVGMVQGSDFPSLDQRGVSRPQLGNPDVGSVERQAGDPTYPPLVYVPMLMRH